MNNTFRKAQITDFENIWEIIKFAKNMRKAEGSNQWQDGYPNEATIKNDINKQNGYVADNQGVINGYFSIKFEKEPEYEAIEGKWKGEGNYAVVHRIAVSQQAKGTGLGKKILEKAEEISREKGVFIVRIDTNFDNAPMLSIIEKLGYTYCGEVYFRGSARKAFEKIL